MIRLTLGERVLHFDEKRTFTAGDLVAIREMGADPNKWEEMVEWLTANSAQNVSDAQYVHLAEALVQIAYLAAVREDHSITWRAFIWSLPIDQSAPWKAEVVPEPVNRAERRAQAKTTPPKKKAAQAVEMTETEQPA